MTLRRFNSASSCMYSPSSSGRVYATRTSGCKSGAFRVSFAAGARSLRQRHLELDLRELLRRGTDAAQERQPARIVVQGFEHRFGQRARQLRVVDRDGLVQPFERGIGLAAVGMNRRDGLRLIRAELVDKRL